MLIRRAFTAVSVLALVALAATQLAVGATPAPKTTEPVRIVPVNVTVTAQRVALDITGVGFQNTVQFRVRNRSGVARTFAIGGQKLRVPQKGFRILLLFFDLRGKYPYTVTPGSKTAHRGIFRVV